MLSRRRFLVAGLSLLASSRLRAAALPTTSADVIVVGAGASGLAAAAGLRARGFSVIVLEGRDRVGGRVWTDHKLGLPLDLGAAWLHGADDNPLVPLARKLGLDLVQTDWLNTDVHDQNGALLPADEVSGSHVAFRAVMKRVLEKRAALRGAPDDMSLEEAVRASIAEVGMPCRPELTDWQIAYLEDDYAEELKRLSLRVCRLDEEFQGGDFLLTGGYRGIIDHLAAGTDVRLSQRVTAIDHGQSPVQVTTAQGAYTARAVLCTLPVGVLHPAAGGAVAGVQFQPGLPAAKLAALGNLATGLMNKVILRFDKPFWTARRDVIGWTGRRHGVFPVFVNGQRLRGAPLLETLVVGDHARSLERLPDESTVNAAMDAIRQIYGPGVPQPTAARITRWGLDPFAGGAYSYARVGAGVGDRQELARPVADRLFFAGEATHEKLAGTVHGAYATGLAQAERIAAALTRARI